MEPKSLADVLVADFWLTTHKRLLWIALSLGLGYWLWPGGVLDTPVSMIALGDWLLIAASVLAYAFGALMACLIGLHLYWVVNFDKR